MEPLRLEALDSVRRVDAAAWDATVSADDPFTEHAFLALLEEAECVGPGTGWVPTPLVVRRGDQLVGAAPLYLKADSYGEYLFDWGWARGAQEAGLRYYPKLTAAVPFTPATGHRLLVHPDAPADRIRDLLGQGALALARRLSASGVHWLYCTEAEARALPGHWVRHSHQLTWTNAGYGSFEDFLAPMSHKRRKEIRRERRRAAGHGLDIVLAEGRDIEARHWRAMHDFYLRTHASRPWQRPYLTPGWWELAPERLGKRAVMALALDGDEPVAASLSFRRGGRLYGRYWGALADLDSMHFELCYHQLVEYAIREGLTRVEAGAQGRHKLSRGFLPEATWSAHWLAHRGLHDAVGRFLREERAEVEAERDWLSEHGPFR